jgi:hypothetical protein
MVSDHKRDHHLHFCKKNDNSFSWVWGWTLYERTISRKRQWHSRPTLFGSSPIIFSQFLLRLVSSIDSHGIVCMFPLNVACILVWSGHPGGMTRKIVTNGIKMPSALWRSPETAIGARKSRELNLELCWIVLYAFGFGLPVGWCLCLASWQASYN